MKPPSTLPDKPSLTVLPLQNLSGDPEQEYFVNGIAEDIIGQLIDTTTGAHICGSRFDGGHSTTSSNCRTKSPAGSSVRSNLSCAQTEIERASRKPTQSLHASAHSTRNRCHLGGRAAQGRLAGT